jgi:Domain of unknown function (DUF6438)/Ankyrin repeats (3 copies)/Ankyrin repeat
MPRIVSNRYSVVLWALVGVSATVIVPGLFMGTTARANENSKELVSFDYDSAQQHEIKPHRRTIPHEGVRGGFNQLHLTLTISPVGDVVDAKAQGESPLMEIWPELEGEVRSWKFTPFEKNGKAVMASVEEYIDLVPPERLPTKHLNPPVLRPDSRVSIKLERTGCFGTCPSYTVTVTKDGIVFEGHGYVVAAGKHVASVGADDVRALAQRFIAGDFYSMDAEYVAGVTDSPTYTLSIDIDGRSKTVGDYVGSWVGMPEVISDLEEAVDELAGTNRWIEGKDGLVDALEKEKFNFKTFEAQVMLKETSMRGEVETVQDFLEAGVPLKPIPASQAAKEYTSLHVQRSGWLTAASRHPETLQVLIDAEANKNDQSDKDLALAGAAKSGHIEAVRALIDYGANSNADLGQETMMEQGPGRMLGIQAAGSVLIYAAESGNPEMVREILRYHPKLEARDRDGETAIFAAAEDEGDAGDSARVECVRILAEAGANVNARDNDGNTALHKTYLTPVVEELLKLGADVNARNQNGDTPIFTNYDNDSILLFMQHGADLTIRNKKGQTAAQAAKERGPDREMAFRKAVETYNSR